MMELTFQYALQGSKNNFFFVFQHVFVSSEWPFQEKDKMGNYKVTLKAGICGDLV